MVHADFVTEDVLLGAPVSEGWWARYSQALREQGIGPVSRRVIQTDASYVVDLGIFGAGEPGDARWPAGRMRSGVVVGAVQSGKTASMMAVSALAIDRRVDVLVVLAGTRTSLWRQTYDRLRAQLDPATGIAQTSRRLLRPLLVGGEGATSVGPSDLYRLQTARVTKALARYEPIVFVAMKQVDHLEHLGRQLREIIYPAAAESRPIHVAVIDDEADDSSIVDLAIEDAHRGGVQKQVPRRIVDLWESRERPGVTVNENVFATYVAYTATPQANFVQDMSNPLAPRDFVVALRAPGSAGMESGRAPTFREPQGLASWYIGGDFFYKKFPKLMCVVDGHDEEDEPYFAASLRAYLVATSVRIWRESERLGPRSARERVYGSSHEARRGVMKPASMLVHPSAMTDDHFEVAGEIVAWSRGEAPLPGAAHPIGTQVLGVEGLRADMKARPERWTRWLEDYVEGASTVAADLGLDSIVGRVPSAALWSEIRDIILDEVAPGTGVSVINSDPAADDRPHFAPQESEGGWRPAANLSTIFVAGNVMARGLTLEGLTTTLFTRSSDAPLADTQMQMQRWFGFRGEILELCRVFLSATQLELFTSYHEADEALRREILAAMDAGDVAPPVTILQGRAFKATAKVTDVRTLDLFPGPKPFLGFMNPPEGDRENLELVARLFSSDAEERIVSDQGVLLRTPRTLVETAEILEGLRYAGHRPSAVHGEAERWRSSERHIGSARMVDCAPLYRPPRDGDSDGRELGARSPYALAAYLRFWDAAIGFEVAGLWTSDERPRRWSLLDQDQLRARAPRFWIGLRTGSGEQVRTGPLASLPFPVRPMRRKLDGGGVRGAWGSRNLIDGRIVGDEVFDYRLRGVDPVTDLNGARTGSDGLLLFHAIDRGSGLATIALGLGVPLGGPDQVAALGRRR